MFVKKKRLEKLIESNEEMLKENQKLNEDMRSFVQFAGELVEKQKELLNASLKDSQKTSEVLKEIRLLAEQGFEKPVDAYQRMSEWAGEDEEE